MPEIPAAFRAYIDQGLTGAVAGLLYKASQYDDRDIIEANAGLTVELLALLTPHQLAASAAALALRERRRQLESDTGSSPSG